MSDDTRDAPGGDGDYGKLAGPGELRALGELLGQAFLLSEGRFEGYVRRVGQDALRRVVRGGVLRAGLGVYDLGLWLGGRSVPAAGVAGVAVAPEARGRGLARALMTGHLREAHAAGVPLSVLHPSTQGPYRSVGYEAAGAVCRHAVAARAIGLADRSLPLTRVTPPSALVESEALHELYRARAREGAGNLDRSRAIWERVAEDPAGNDVYVYAAGDPPQGYAVYAQVPDEQHYSLAVRDLVCRTETAARALLTLFADARSMVTDVAWHGPPVDPLATLLPEQDVRVVRHVRSMLRVVDVPRALELRGWRPQAQGELHLDVRDALLPANHGRFVLAVAGGKAEVRRGGAGALALDVRGLAPLYTGMLSPRELRSIGLLSGDDAAVATAGELFAGPAPWMPDMF